MFEHLYHTNRQFSLIIALCDTSLLTFNFNRSAYLAQHAATAAPRSLIPAARSSIPLASRCGVSGILPCSRREIDAQLPTLVGLRERLLKRLDEKKHILPDAFRGYTQRISLQRRIGAKEFEALP
jgi:hypothetical protein